MTPEEEHRLRADAAPLLSNITTELHLQPIPRGPAHRTQRRAFDTAMTELHYAGRCQRVGRCMRLLIVDGATWVGGMVLGSTFPNIECRDEALDLKRHVRGTEERGLRSPWCSENRDYWKALQGVVNHARTFIFPSAQGRGVAIEAHRLLLDEGIVHWQSWYPGEVTAIDTLCDDADSGLFRRNGWTHVGHTKGYGSDRSTSLVDDDGRGLKNNVALGRNSRPWEVWVKELRLTDDGR